MTATDISITPHFFVSTQVLTMHYTTYRPWSGKCYGRGRVSGASAVPAKQLVKVLRVTEKAVQLQYCTLDSDGTVVAIKKAAWAPKSRCKFNQDGSFTVSRGFCHFALFPKWVQL